jgi:hypothetical protein
VQRRITIAYLCWSRGVGNQPRSGDRVGSCRLVAGGATELNLEDLVRPSALLRRELDRPEHGLNDPTQGIGLTLGDHAKLGWGPLTLELGGDPLGARITSSAP